MKLIFLITALATVSLADKLAYDQEAPDYASSSGGDNLLISPEFRYTSPQNSGQYNTYETLNPQEAQFKYTQQQPQQHYQPQQSNYPQQTHQPQNNYNTHNTHNPYQPQHPPQGNYNQGNTYVPPQEHYPTPIKPVTPPVPIVSQESVQNVDGSYKYQYVTGDNTKVEQEGFIAHAGQENEGSVVKGSYSYVGTDGVTYTVTYTADENGFVATGAHIPTPPPIPHAIQQALEQNAKEEAALAAANQNKYPAGGSPNYPAHNYPQNNYPQNNYVPPQNNHVAPSQQTYYPPQHSHYPQQGSNYPQQGSNYGQQSGGYNSYQY